MKTPAIIASLTVAGSLAFAAGQQTGGKQLPALPSGAQSHSMREEMPEARMAQADCPSGVRLEWFSPVPHRIGCDTSLLTPLVADYGPAQDVNGDGVIEYWYNQHGQGTVIQDGSVVHWTVEQRDIVITRLEPGTSATMWDRVSVVPQDFGAWVQSQVPNCGYAVIMFPWGQPGFHGWRDIDGDGDLDFITYVSFSYPGNGNGSGAFQVWFENIGYQKPAPPVAADLNQDGRVDGQDLGRLLASWGPNP